MFDEGDTIIVSAAIATCGYPKAVGAWQRVLDDILKTRATGAELPLSKPRPCKHRNKDGTCSLEEPATTVFHQGCCYEPCAVSDS
jgi:hypothetical protein